MNRRNALICVALGFCAHLSAKTPQPTLSINTNLDYDGLITTPNGKAYFGQQWLENASEVTLYPKNGNSALWTLTLTYSDGRPAVGKTITINSTYNTLTTSSWRDKNTMANRFPSGSRATVIQRIDQGLFRLRAPYEASSLVTDANGQVKVTVNNFHSCGNEQQPGSDKLTASTGNLQAQLIVKCAVTGLVNIPDRASEGLTTAGLVGRHLHPDLLSALQNLGQAWKNVQNKPVGMPNYLIITGATMRWGGINPPHFTHKFGGTVDIRPIGTSSGPVSVGDAHYHRQATQTIVDALVQLGATKIIFADNLKGVTDVKSNHKNHLHVSFLTEPLEPWLAPNDNELDSEGEAWHDYSNIYDTSYFVPQVKSLQVTDFHFELGK
ncbi:hypothetical protein WLQ65_18425 [Pseudoalteromonas piscicida]|uniref:hypothetical protein n=1 Tax=Pseudoalteromonas piscicida TaxID=43662 RepID=UPI0030C93717